MESKFKKLMMVFAACWTVAGGAFAGTFKHIAIDGSFADWTGVPVAYSQAQDVTNAVAYQNIYVANDEDYLYVRFSIYGSADPFTSLQNIFVDADNNAATGYHAHGLVGSEMLIQAGAGYQEKNGGFNEGPINALDWQAAPAGSASEFEFRISRAAVYATNGAPVFSNNTIAFVLESEAPGFVSVEWVPPTTGGLTYTFASAASNGPGQNLVTNTYTTSTEDFANPERGFYIQADNHASAPTAVPGGLASYRINGKSSPGNTYSAKISLLLRLFYLDSFINAPISSNFLNSIQADFNSVRAQGDKVIVRFAYTKNTTRPFNEPTKARILSHIEQLGPVLKANSDVIAVMQMGMIAAWGEGYYTDVFYTNGQATAQNWLDRIDVLNAELAVLPPERMIQVRVPQFKQKYVYGPSASTGVAPLTPAMAFTGSNVARIGFHNDCYLASSTDFGTFSDNDYGAGTSSQDIANFRNYLAQETRFAPMGGETCNVYPPTTDCASAGGNADLDMAISHYSFLNEGYNASVNDQWAAQGCIEEIKRRLGYRLALVSGVFRTEAQPGQTIPLTLTFTNGGFAAPYNFRGLEVILRNVSTGKKFFAELSRNADARRWLPGTNYAVSAQLSLPADMPLGDYDMLLNLPDPAPTLYTNMAYSIRLANSNAVSSIGTLLNDVWEPTTGYHRLGQTLTVNATATNAAPGGAVIPVLNFSAIAETYNTWKGRNFPTNAAAGSPELDPDSDTRVNLLEYAIGSNPNVAESNRYWQLSLTNDSLIFSITKGPGVKDVRYEIEGSTSLTSPNWSTSSVTVLKNDSSVIEGRYSELASNAFLRLKLSLQ
jgi:hypothetical protein